MLFLCILGMANALQLKTLAINHSSDERQSGYTNNISEMDIGLPMGKNADCRLITNDIFEPNDAITTSFIDLYDEPESLRSAELYDLLGLNNTSGADYVSIKLDHKTQFVPIEWHSEKYRLLVFQILKKKGRQSVQSIASPKNINNFLNKCGTKFALSGEIGSYVAWVIAIKIESETTRRYIDGIIEKYKNKIDNRAYSKLDYYTDFDNAANEDITQSIKKWFPLLGEINAISDVSVKKIMVSALINSNFSSPIVNYPKCNLENCKINNVNPEFFNIAKIIKGESIPPTFIYKNFYNLANTITYYLRSAKNINVVSFESSSSNSMKATIVPKEVCGDYKSSILRHFVMQTSNIYRNFIDQESIHYLNKEEISELKKELANTLIPKINDRLRIMYEHEEKNIGRSKYYTCINQSILLNKNGELERFWQFRDIFGIIGNSIKKINSSNIYFDYEALYLIKGCVKANNYDSILYIAMNSVEKNRPSYSDIIKVFKNELSYDKQSTKSFYIKEILSYIKRLNDSYREYNHLIFDNNDISSSVKFYDFNGDFYNTKSRGGIFSEKSGKVSAIMVFESSVPLQNQETIEMIFFDKKIQLIPLRNRENLTSNKFIAYLSCLDYKNIVPPDLYQSDFPDYLNSIGSYKILKLDSFGSPPSKTAIWRF